MDAIIFLTLFSSIFLPIKAYEEKTHYPKFQCGHDTPEIHYPFWVKTNQPQIYGHPNFKLICQKNTTMIQFPDRNLVVKSISYQNKKLDLVDPKNCVHEVFLNLNLSTTPFNYYYLVKNYTYLNCSSKLSKEIEIPCLSGKNFHVYTVDSSMGFPDFCRVVKIVEIPFKFSPYLADNSFGLGLTWELTEWMNVKKQDFSLESNFVK